MTPNPTKERQKVEQIVKGLDAEEVRAQIDAVTSEIFAKVKPSEPEPVCWLTNGGEDLCWDCAVKERGKQFDIGIPLTGRRFFKTELECVFYDGIDGGYDGQMPSDTTEWCECCNTKLAYTLTDYGLAEEVSHWLSCELTAFGPDDAYDIERLAMAVWPEGDEEHLRVAQDVLTVCLAVRSFIQENGK